MINRRGARPTRCRLQKTLFTLLVLAYLGILGYFLTVRPSGAGGNPVVVWAITAFASGGMMFMGMFAVALYLFRRKEKAALYFALICAGAAVRFFFMEGSQTVMALVPDFPHSAIYGVRYIAMSASQGLYTNTSSRLKSSASRSLS